MLWMLPLLLNITELQLLIRSCCCCFNIRTPTLTQQRGILTLYCRTWVYSVRRYTTDWRSFRLLSESLSDLQHMFGFLLWSCWTGAFRASWRRWNPSSAHVRHTKTNTQDKHDSSDDKHLVVWIPLVSICNMLLTHSSASGEVQSVLHNICNANKMYSTESVMMPNIRLS